jgi:N-acetylmuramoyl-L-alanine amidase CwlA
MSNYKDAFYWSEAVRNEMNDGNKYAASFQYTVGNDGIFHNIPDNEIAYHAGDSTQFDYALYDTKIPVSEKYNITIKNNLYYINDICTNIKSPVVEGITLTEKDINDYGILCVNKNGTYHIGETYYNNTYKKIANRGGNNNGIGMEVCVNEGADIYLNWQRSAKLTAYLLEQNNLEIDDIKPHHYFSGKNCPMTLRENKLWNHFLEMVQVEYDVLQFIKEGYSIKLIPLTNNILDNGRILDLSKPLKFKIVTIYNGVEDIYE